VVPQVKRAFAYSFHPTDEQTADPSRAFGRVFPALCFRSSAPTVAAALAEAVAKSVREPQGKAVSVPEVQNEGLKGSGPAAESEYAFSAGKNDSRPRDHAKGGEAWTRGRLCSVLATADGRVICWPVRS